MRSSTRLRDTLPVAVAVLAHLTLVGCSDATARDEAHTDTTQGDGIRTTTLEAGPPTLESPRPNAFENDEREIAEGKRLYGWMNCAGCHGPLGGGGIGPPLADHDWIYGSESEHIYQSIMQGRPNGMPAFRNKVTEASAWRIAAYVRSMSEGEKPEPEDRTKPDPTDNDEQSGSRQ